MTTSGANENARSDLKIRIGKRLLAAAEYVAVSSMQGRAVCADIGCDHGYLSIYLAEKGICEKVYAADINEKPVNIAKENIRKRDTKGFDLAEKIEVRLCDGLSGLSGLGINNVIICGMGGEVISGIIGRAKEFHIPQVQFVLQPMSSEMELRMWLCENGFEICDEKLVRDSGRIYTVMSARYTGKKYIYTQAELVLGRHNIEKNTELLYELCERKLVHARNLLKQPCCSEKDRELKRELSEILKSKKE